MTYIKNNLILEFDTNDINLSDLSLSSKLKWNEGKFNDFTLNDYGLNQYDIGLSTDLKNSKQIVDQFLKLERIGELSGNTIDYSNYELNSEIIPNIGTILKSNGGYLLNPFKYHEYEIEYLPRKYPNGFTFETTLLIDQSTFTGTTNNSNIFLYLGIRSEDKFAESYSGNSTYITSEGAILDNSYKIFDISNLPENTQNFDKIITFLKTENLYIKENNQKDFIINDILFEDIRLIYNGIELIKDTNFTVDIRNKKITLINIDVVSSDILVINHYVLLDDINLANIDLKRIDNYNSDQNFNLENNVIAFKFDNNGRIGYRRINKDNIIEEDYSLNQAAYNGWNHIVITFKPNTIEEELVDDSCILDNPRKGTLSIFVNGIEFYKNTNFIEPLFNPLPIHRSKQIGVPYNLSWGGGSVGLKNSYNFNGIDNNTPFEENINNSNLLIEKYFDGYFKGGFNKLRIYNKYLTTQEIKTNFRFESDFYGINFNRGGRLIYINDFVV